MAETFCTGLSENISTWGQCLIETGFFGDALLAAIILYLAICVLIYTYRLPGQLALPIGLVLSASIYMIVPGEIHLAIFAVALILNFAWAGLAILHKTTVA